MLDPDRQMRFLYPSVFFMGWLLWGLHLDPTRSLSDVFPMVSLSGSFDRLVAVGATSGAVLIASGFVIGSLSILVLKAVFWFDGRPYEACLSREGLDLIYGRVGMPGERQDTDTLFLSAILDHELLNERLHRWVFRRWSMFYVAMNAAMGLVVALGVGSYIGIAMSRAWVFQSITAVALFVVIARWAWLDTMGMLDFQARRLGAQPQTLNGSLQLTSGAESSGDSKEQ